MKLLYSRYLYLVNFLDSVAMESKIPNITDKIKTATGVHNPHHCRQYCSKQKLQRITKFCEELAFNQEKFNRFIGVQ